MRKHQAANDALRTTDSLGADVRRRATAAWDRVIKIGEANGYRNAQASVCAPTGTIGFMMDCDTTGIEPDFSLVKFKKLVGGGSLQIVNQTIPRAPKKLGYANETAEAIIEFIAENGHVIDAPGLKPEHHEVFDTAMGQRAIKPMGHARTMAAAQPFLSGAISKTVNLPETATVEDIADVYLQGWKLGLKALAVYRDNRKVGQPLSDAKSSSADDKAAVPSETETVEKVVYRPTRKRLPKSRPSRTTSLRWRCRGLHDLGLLSRRRTRRGVPQARRAGSTLAGVMDAFSIAAVDRTSVRRAAGDVRAEVHQPQVRAGRSDRRPRHPAQSIMDYIFRRLALDYLSFDERSSWIYTAPSARVTSRQVYGLNRAGGMKRGAIVEERRWRSCRHRPDGSRPRHRSTGLLRPVPAGTGPGARTSSELFEEITGTQRRRAPLPHLRHQDASKR